jgi:ATP-dependent exoDNAse (exonuclease V) beta subunit
MSRPPFDLLSHQVVRASAGAGKTYQLTTRYLELLVRQEPVEQILATTFTRKAAGEVLARVLGRLATACDDEAARRQLAQALGQSELSRVTCLAMLRSIAEGLHRLAVGTIDGFFNRAANVMAMDLGLPPDPAIIDEGSPLAQQMRFDAIQAVLGEQADNEDGLFALIEMLRRLHHDTAQRSVTDAIDHIVRDLGEVYRSYPEAELWDQLPDAGRLQTEILTTAIERIEGKLDDLPRTAKGTFHKAFHDRVHDLLADAHAGHWDDVLFNGLVAKVIDEETKYGHAPITDDWAEAIRPLALHARAIKLGAFADQTRATYDLLHLFDERYKATRYAKRVLLFSDLTDVLADGLPSLGEAGVDELCYRLDAKVTHLLLDEFQDTSLRQWQVLEPFAQLITDNFEDSRSLFCVGDTKQAIYGWRGGCAELFDVVEALPGVEPRTLSKSYRSSQIVLDAVNRVFSQLVGNPAMEKCEDAAAQWQAGFEPHAAVKDTLPGHVVLQTTASDVEGDDAGDTENEADAPPDAHAAYVARYVRSLVEDHPGQTIGVLMRSRAKARTLMHALRSLGVHAAEEGGNPIHHNPAVAAVLAAIRFADHPGDRVARFHATNSPIGELLGLTSDEPPEAIARRIRRTLIDEGYAAVLSRWVRVLAPSCDAASLRRLMQLIELAQSYDEQGATLRPSFFVDSVESAKVEDASPALVRVMTIHASKGLEFDAVVLPDLDGMLSAQDQRDLIVMDRDSPIDPVRGIYRRVPKPMRKLTQAIDDAHEQRATEKRTEDLCLLYVAMTRARQALHLLVRPLTESRKKNKDSGMKEGTGEPTSAGLKSLSYSAILRQALSTLEDEGFEGDACLYEHGTAEWSAREKSPAAAGAIEPTGTPPSERIHLAHANHGTTRSWVKTSPSDLRDEASVRASDLLRFGKSGGQRYGTLVHAMLEFIGFVDEGVPNVETLQQAGRCCASAPEDVEAAAAALHETLHRDEAQKLLARDGTDELWRERRFTTRLDDRLVVGSFDRVHLWRDAVGKPIRARLIDYKTDRVDDASIAAKTALYAEQLRLYRAVLSQMLRIEPSDIETVLYFVGDDRVSRVD